MRVGPGADERLGTVAQAACGLQNRWNKDDVWVTVKLGLLGSLSHVTGLGTGCCNEAEVGREWSNNCDINEHGGAVLIKHKVHAACLTWLFTAAVRLGGAGKGHCGTPAVDASTGLAHISPVALLLGQTVALP